MAAALTQLMVPASCHCDHCTPEPAPAVSPTLRRATGKAGVRGPPVQRLLQQRLCKKVVQGQTVCGVQSGADHGMSQLWQCLATACREPMLERLSAPGHADGAHADPSVPRNPTPAARRFDHQLQEPILDKRA